jgi:hypothetical protein
MTVEALKAFCTAWEQTDSIADAALEANMEPKRAQTLAAMLRKKGVQLKKMQPVSGYGQFVDALNEHIAEQ